MIGVAEFSSGKSVEQGCGGSKVVCCIYSEMEKPQREGIRKGGKQIRAAVWEAGRSGVAAENEVRDMRWW